jgi:hypothetical protein
MTVVGFLLRRYHLGAESLWFDEADIVAQARQSLLQLIEAFTKAGENGPLYTLVLHYWLALESNLSVVARLMDVVFGSSLEAHVRGLSMLFGTAAIPLMFVFARRVGGVALGLTAAALLTINPFALWYSQDAKMYSLLVLMTLLTSILYVRAIESNAKSAWALYIIATWIMLTAHSLAGLVLLAQILAAPILLRRMADDRSQTTDDRGGKLSARRGFRLFWSMVIILAPLLPIIWLLVAAVVTGTVDTGNWYAATSLPDILLTIFVKFAVNQAAPASLGSISIPWETIGALAMAVLAVVGVWAMVRTTDDRPPTTDDGPSPPRTPRFLWFLPQMTQSPESVQSQSEFTFHVSRFTPSVVGLHWLVFLLWLVPVLVFWLVTLAVPLFQPRYLIMALPAYLIMAAAGILALRRVNPGLAAVPVALLGISTVAAMLTINYSPTPQKEDWRGAMVYVQDHLRPYDAIFVFPGYLQSAVQVYYKPGGSSQVPEKAISTVPNLITHNYGQRELQADLLKIATCNQRAWVILSPVREEQEDPQHKVLQWFQYNYHTFDTQVFNGVTVYGVTFNGQPNCWYPGPDVTEPYQFENGPGLLGYTYQVRGLDNWTGKPVPPQPDASYFPLTLYWRTNGTKLPDYDVEVKVTGPSGVVVDQTMGPLNGYWPSSQWPVNDFVLDYRDLRLPGGLTPGDYKVSLRIFPKGHPDQPLKLKDGSTEITLKTPLPVVPWKP